MANYQLLKADIDAKVYQNGKQEITGANLNSVLNAMVTTLGAEYQFAGVATIDTNPGTPDAKVFYIANGKGTYTNFGGLEVTEDEVVVLYWDTAWHKEATGIASHAKLTELESKVDITSAPYGVFYIPQVSVENNKFITSAGTKEDSNAYNVASLTMYRGELLVVRCVASPSVAAISIKNGNVYDIIKIGEDGSNYSTYTILVDVQSEVCISYRNSNDFVPNIYKSRVTDIPNEITLDGFEQIVGTLDAQKYIDPSGNYSSNANFSIYTINLTAGDYLLAEVSASSSVAVISEVVDNVYIPKIIGVNGYKYLMYKYLATKDITVAVCGRYYANKSYVIKTYKKTMKEFLKINKDDIDYIKSFYPLFISPSFVESSNKITAEINNGSYIDYDGSIGTASNYSRTNPFTVEAGKTVVLKCSAGNGCAVIAEFDDETLTYNPIKIGTGNQYYFSYTPVRNTKVVLSFRNTEEYYYSLSDITADAISKIRGDYLEREDYLKYFNSILCIGDSVTAGAVADYPRTTGSIAEDIPKFSYPTQLKKMIGCDVVNAGFSGYSPKQWYDEKINQYTYSDYNLVLIELGYNGGIEDTLDTDVIPYTDYHNYADTACGNYCKIIGAIKESNPNAMIVLIISPGMTMVHTDTPATIKHIANIFNLQYIDLRPNIIENLNDNKFHGKVSGGSRDMIHFNPIGYIAKASLLKKMLSIIVYNNLQNVNNSVPI